MREIRLYFHFLTHSAIVWKLDTALCHSGQWTKHTNNNSLTHTQKKPMKKAEALYLKWCVGGGEGGLCNIIWQAIELTWRGRSLLTRCQQQGGHHQHRLQPASASIPLPPLTFIPLLAHLSDGPSISPSIWPPHMHHFVTSREFLSVYQWESTNDLRSVYLLSCPLLAHLNAC